MLAPPITHLALRIIKAFLSQFTKVIIGMGRMQIILYRNEMLLKIFFRIYAAKHEGFLPYLKEWALGTLCRLLHPSPFSESLL